jgi:hypothetical protein
VSKPGANIGGILVRFIQQLAWLCCLVGPAAYAGTIGNYDWASCYPFLCNDSGTDVGPSITYQQAYRASAFSGPITISTLSFYSYDYNSAGNVLGGDYQIYLSTTSRAVGNLHQKFSQNLGADNALFYSGNLAGAVNGNEFDILGTPFLYDPADGNLLMTIYVSGQDNVPNGDDYSNGFFWADYPDNGKVHATARNYVVGSGTKANKDDNLLGLVTGFNEAAAVPEPASLALLGCGLGALAVLGRKKR